MSTTSHPDSYYVASASGIPDHAPLTGDIRCDVCIIGGGFTGVSTLLHLAERGYDAILIEARKVGWGASGRNGGQVGSGQRRDQQDLEKWGGRGLARALWDLGEEAKATVRDRVRRHGIDCDLKPGILSAGHRPDDAAWFQQYASWLVDRYVYTDAEPVSADEMAEMLGSTIYHGGWLDRGAAHLHPLNYVLGLARAAVEAGGRIFEGTAAERISGESICRVHTSAGIIRSEYLVLACNGYLGRLEPRAARHIMPINNFVIATEPLGADRARSLIRDDVAVHDSKFVIDYYRLSADHRLLFGGGETYRRRFPRDIKAFVRPLMLEVFPQLADVRIDHGWGGTLAITLPRLPQFARLGPRTYIAHGYSGHGIALATLAGKIIAEAVAGTAERFDLMASLKTPAFPGGTLLRWPGLVLGMTWYALRDRL